MVTGLIQSLFPALLLTASLVTTTSPSSTIARSELAPLPLASVSAYLRPSLFHVVNSGDTLGSIAESEYGDAKYWTSLWNDNPWIEDPNIIEDNWQIKIRPTYPLEVEMLKPQLLEKLNPQEVSPLPTANSQTIQTAVIPPAPLQVTQPVSAGPLSETQLNFLGSCESGMTAARNSGNGYYGAFQFSVGTWKSMGTGYERADMAPLEVQKDAVQRLVSRSSIFSQFPGCSAKMRSQGIL